jgi:hypothetical protein
MNMVSNALPLRNVAEVDSEELPSWLRLQQLEADFATLHERVRSLEAESCSQKHSLTCGACNVRMILQSTVPHARSGDFGFKIASMRCPACDNTRTVVISDALVD